MIQVSRRTAAEGREMLNVKKKKKKQKKNEQCIEKAL